MSQRELNRRFAEALLTLRNGVAVSLPLAGPFGERLFFYETARTEGGGLCLYKVDSVATRDRDGRVTVQPVHALLSPEALARFTDVPIPEGPTGDAAAEAMRLFFEAYDRALPLLTAASDAALPADAGQLLRGYTTALGRLVPAGALRELYLTLGAETFRLIRRLSGG